MSLLDEFSHFIATLGFPIFVAVILLLRVDQMHAENIRAINELTQAISQLITVIASNGNSPEDKQHGHHGSD